MKGQRSRAFSFRANRKEELEFKKEIERIRHQSKTSVTEQNDPENLTSSSTTKIPTETVLQDSPTLKSKKRDTKPRDRDVRGVQREKRNPKLLAVVGSLNTTVPAPFAERKLPAVPQSTLQRMNGETVATESSRVSTAASQSKAMLASNSNVRVENSQTEVATSKTMLTTGRRPPHSSPAAVIHQAPSVGSSDIFDEDADLKSMGSLWEQQKRREEKSPVKEPVTRGDDVGKDASVRPSELKETEYRELMDELARPVSTGDVVCVRGKTVERPKTATRPIQRRTDVLERAQKATRVDHSSMHDFCVRDLPSLSPKLQRLSYQGDKQKQPTVPPPSMISQSSLVVTPHGLCHLEKRLDDEKIDKNVSQGFGLAKRSEKIEWGSKGAKGDLDPKEWLDHLSSLLGNMMKIDGTINVQGAPCEIVTEPFELNWHPAPPKLNVHPDVIQSELFPEYRGVVLADFEDDPTVDPISDEEQELEKLEEDRIAQEEAASLRRVLNRRHGSAINLTECTRRQFATPEPFVRVDVSEVEMTADDTLSSNEPQITSSVHVDERDEETDSSSSTASLGLKAYAGYQPASARKQTLTDLQSQWEVDDDKAIGMEKLKEEQQEDIVSYSRLRRAISQPFLGVSSEELTLASDYDETMKELEEQKMLLAKAKQPSLPGVEHSGIWTHSYSSSVTNTNPSPLLPKGAAKVSQGSAITSSDNIATISDYMRRHRSRRISKGSKSATMTKAARKRAKYLLTTLQRPQLDCPPSRRASMPCLRYCTERSKCPSKKEAVVKFGSLQRSTSVVGDSAGMFDKWATQSTSSLLDPFSWAQLKWDKWFDELYAEGEASKSRAKSNASQALVHLEDLENLEIAAADTPSQHLFHEVEKESERLTYLIDTSSESISFNLCRRGALYRKLGRLKDAVEDLNRAIELEPSLLDAYWHRHLLHLLQNNENAALSDLSFIAKHNKTQSRVYRSTGEILARKGDLTMAVANYSQAVKLEPNNGEVYYRRAQLFGKGGDFVSALEDYAMASKLIPTKLDAFFQKGKYNFESGFWTTAIEDFTAILNQDPNNSLVRTYRGRTYAKQEKFHQALTDLSAAIHLDPNSATAFYHRGCLLRKADPQRALRDLSVSLLLDDSMRNVLAYFHRGILYTDMKQFNEAIPDFEACVKLNKNISAAHVNLGLICMQHLKDYDRAIHCFSRGIRADPTYCRAYVCRADGYNLIDKLDDAIRDYSRAIHLNPVVPSYHLYRGKLLLRKGQLEKAAAHVRYAAKLDKDSLGASVMQQAVVESFLHNYDKATAIINSALQRVYSPALLILAGRTHMKAKQYREAIRSFETALEAMATPVAATNLPCSRAEIFFFIGQSYEELQRNDRALSAYNGAIRRDPRLSKAYYQRGLVRFKLHQSRAVTDFNRALAVDSTLFQAYLSRAAYYALNKRYTKAILNCNEAARLQPYSVRTYLYRGALKYYIRAYAQAIEDLSRAVWIDRQCTLAYYNRACCYQKLKRTHEALVDYSVVLLMDSGPILKILINRGLLYFEIKDYGNALLDFLAASEHLGTDACLFHTIGLCYHKLNKLTLAIASFTRVIQLDNHFLDAFVCRGNAYVDLRTEYGNAMALRDYGRAIYLDPTCLAARVNAGFTLQTMGKFQKAWMQFTGAFNIDSSYIPALEGRAVVSLQMRNFYAAILDLSKAVRMRPSAELLTNRGVVYQFMKDTVNAMKDFQAAIQLDLNYSLAYFNAANLYFGQRQFHRALDYYTNALKLEPNDESVLLNRAITRVILGQSDEALEDFNKAALHSPHWAHIYYNRGNLYKSLGRFNEAEMDYTRALALQPGDSLTYNQRADAIAKQDREEEALADYRRAVYLESDDQKAT